MDAIEKIKEEKISTNFFNLISSFVNHSEESSKKEEMLAIAIQKLKEAYPQLSDLECSAICSPWGLTGNEFRLRGLLLVDNTILWFINNVSNNLFYSHYSRLMKVDPSKSFYRLLSSEYFFYNLDNRTHFTEDGKIFNPNYTGLSSEEELQYTHFIATALTQFLKDQNIELQIVPDDQTRVSGEIYNHGRLLVDSSWNFMDSAIYVDRNFVDLAQSFATHQDCSMNLIFVKEKSLKLSATLHQTFDELGNCTIQLCSTEIPYFSLNHGSLKTTKCNDIETIVPYQSADLRAESDIYKAKFPYNAIFIDEDKKESFIESLPNITSLPLLSIPSSLPDMELSKFFYEQGATYRNSVQKQFVISGRPTAVTVASALNFDTCFINSGLNDFESYHTTYEVPKIEKVKAIRLETQ